MADVFPGLALVLVASQGQGEGLILEFVFLSVAVLIRWAPVTPPPLVSPTWPGVVGMKHRGRLQQLL